MGGQWWLTCGLCSSASGWPTVYVDFAQKVLLWHSRWHSAPLFIQAIATVNTAHIDRPMMRRESGQLGGGIEIENKFSNDDDEGNGKWEMATTMAMATSWPCLSYPACNWTILFLFIFVCCCAAHFVHLHFPFSISPVNVVQSNKRECECEWRQATGGADTCRGLSPSPVCPVLSCPILS